jgi:hypothetical protein
MQLKATAGIFVYEFVPTSTGSNIVEVTYAGNTKTVNLNVANNTTSLAY